MRLRIERARVFVVALIGVALLPSFGHAAEGTPIVSAKGESRVSDMDSVPERHWPRTYMGRDFWRVLYKYADFTSNSADASPARVRRFDNPAIYKCPAFEDVASDYFGRRQPPKTTSERSVWRTLGENFLENDLDREILTSNPDPVRPFFLTLNSRRSIRAWAKEPDLDFDEYERFKSAHPNLVCDGRLAEWLNDLMFSYGTVERMPEGEIRSGLKNLLGANIPNDRYGISKTLRRYYERRKRTYYDGRVQVLDGHLHTFHIAKDFGAEFFSLETTDTTGYGTTPSDKVIRRRSYECDGTAEDTDDNSAYRWNVSAMFARGAARQFKSIWQWYLAGYTNGWTEDGKWWNNAITVYPAETPEPDNGENPAYHGGPEFGQSMSNLRRGFFLAYLSGCTFVNMEEWTAQFTMWDGLQKKTVLSPRGKMYVDFAEFTRRHPDRGATYAPVAVCVPVAQGYPSWGGYPWGLKRCGYTRGDTAVDAFFFTVVPGYERAKEHRRGTEYNIPHSRYANMYDVISPDVRSQTEDGLLDVFKCYKALVVAGDYQDRAFEKILSRYVAEGGRVIHLDQQTVQQEREERINDIKAGRVRFPEVEKIVGELQRSYFPFDVKGDVCYGLNRTKSGWWLWAINSKGVTKFVDKPERIDFSKNAELTVSVPSEYGRAVRELTKEEPVVMFGGAFRAVIPAGDLRIFEIRK